MPKQIISDSFETLTGAAQTVVNDVVENIGIKPPQAGSSEQGGGVQQQQKTDDQIKKMGASAKNVARKRYNELQDEIKQLQIKRRQDMIKYHQPGFTDEEKQKNQVKQLEEKPSFAPADAKAVAGKKAAAGKESLPPFPVQQAAHKTEKFRGSSG